MATLLSANKQTKMNFIIQFPKARNHISEQIEPLRKEEITRALLTRLFFITYTNYSS